MKTCGKCGDSKPATEYGKATRRADGLQFWCKSCKAAYQSANREKHSASSASYYAANREKVSAQRANYYAANKEEFSTRSAQWRAANPEARCIYEHNRRSRKREAGGKLSTGLASRLHTLQRGKCACGCKQPLGDDYHLDHIMPIALGGTNTDDNIQLLRQRCNNQKHAKHPIDFMQQRGFLL